VKPTLAVWKFASCDGCQLSLLDCEDELLQIAEIVEIAYFPEATSAVSPGPYDLSLVEGSITTPDDALRIQEVRRTSEKVIAIGACATAGGIQALRNWSDVGALAEAVYPEPSYIETLETSTAISEHIEVDFELRGCPVSKRQLIDVIGAFVHRRKPNVMSHSVCIECKERGIPCVMVAGGTPCLGPVTHAGCGALCPAFARGCYGCFGPSRSPNVASLKSWWLRLGKSDQEVALALSTFNAAAPEFRDAVDER
jgi:coenzyme F420-reducing hydrogenase gamma subunit